eukprot:12788355-Prorocentrum_lima.AAC.1
MSTQLQPQQYCRPSWWDTSLITDQYINNPCTVGSALHGRCNPCAIEQRCRTERQVRKGG